MGAGPFRAVTHVRLVGGSSIYASFKHHWWELTLECGHKVERRIRWLPVPNTSRGWAAQHRGVSLDRLPPKPKRARCETCRAPQ